MATQLSEMGEFGLIDHLTKNISLKNKSSILGVGDDAAIVKTDKNLVVTTDLLMEGIHFDLMYTPLKHLGYKAVMVNLSDVYAMNARPTQIVISLGISAKFSIESMEELYDGINLACERYGVDLVGGDTTSSVTGLAISITAMGEVEEGKEAKRSGAKVNDLICISGDLGGAFFGLQLLEREKKIYNDTKGSQPKLDGYDYVLERLLKPEARKDIFDKLAEQGVVPTSMIDVSDGLSSELMHICDKSGVGCRVYEEKIPINEATAAVAKEFDMEPLVAALNGGEDYELLFTVSMEDIKKVHQMDDVVIIGNITEKADGPNLVTRAGTFIELKAQGWNQFSKDE